MLRVRILLAVVLGLMASPAMAATLQVTQGSVSINRGQGFEPATGTTTVNPGDTVVVQPGGNAQIVYPDGSVATLQPGSVVTVAEGAGAGATGAAGFGTTELVIAGVVVAVGVTVAVVIANNQGSSP